MVADTKNEDVWAYAPNHMNADVFQKFSALVETLLIIGASIAFALVAQQLVKPGLGQTLGLIDGAAPDFLASSLILLQQFALQYGGMLVVVLVFAFTRGRKSFKSYALTKGGRSIRQLVVFGLVGGALAAIPTEAIFLAKELYPIGADTPIWSVVKGADWDWTFWVFMAVGSFVIVPILEEAAWRGYALGRVVENFRPGAALVVTAITFGLMHTQYLANSDMLGYLTMAAVIFSALVFGAMTLWTGSLLPAVIAHIMINVPKTFEVGVIVLMAYVVISIIAWRQIGKVALAVLKEIIRKDTAIALGLITVLIGLGVAAATFKTVGLIAFGVAAFAIAVGSSLVRRSAWAVTTDPE